MGTKLNPGRFDCYTKAKPNEPIFVLLARDPLAAATVRYWAQRHGQALGHNDKTREAMLCANAMDLWRTKMLIGKQLRRMAEFGEPLGGAAASYFFYMRNFERGRIDEVMFLLFCAEQIEND